MSEPPELEAEPRVRGVGLARCPDCQGLHLILRLGDGDVLNAVMMAEDWATLFLRDEAFAAAVVARLGRH